MDFTGSPHVAVTVNGSVPAPTLRWREGDTVTLRVTNTLREDTSIHWHGILLPANMDGVPGLSFNGIRPGETHAYRFTVRDDGPGIDPAHHDRVFEVFQTLTPRSKLDSSGIGLSIVARLVASAGGSVHIESGAGERGTAIHFTWNKNWPTGGD